MINIERLSDKYIVKKLGFDDIQDIYDLCYENRLYYEYCPPMVTTESIKKDMLALPPNISADKKFYIGFYSDEKLIAVMDLIYDYPEPGIAFIGFFMTSTAIQNKGIGSGIISELCDYLKAGKYDSIRLSWVEGNPQAEHFWIKNGFKMLKKTTSNVSDSVILAERLL